MSHVDDGTLHAYLDGALAPVERTRLERHLADCTPCRDRLEEERSLIERADRLLALAAPPAGHVTRPLPRPGPRRRSRYLVRGVWAASIAAAFIAGWMLRSGARTEVEGGAGVPRQQADAADSATTVADAHAPAIRDQPRARPPRAAAAAQPPPAPDSGAVIAAASASLTAESATGKPAPSPGMAGAAAPPTLRGGAPVPVPRAAVAITPPLSLYRSQAAEATLGTSWVAIDAEPARRLLGTEVVRIPGLPVRAMLRNPAVPGAVMVEQEVAEGTVIQLLQSRLDQQPGPARAGGLRRTVGRLEVRISGPLSTDSLLKLLQLAR